MTIAQTPLLGDENTPLHVDSSGGTGFGSATPRHQVAFTPNPLATPMHVAGLPDGSVTPSSMIAGTPLRTPRDSLSINASDQYSSVGDTPRDQRLRVNSAKQALKAGLLSLPKPENNFELLAPEDEEDPEQDDTVMSQEDAAERDARIQRLLLEEQAKALARRSQVVQRNLPRPANVDAERLLRDLSVSSDDNDAQRLVNEEIVQLLLHDSIAFPIPGTSRLGSTQSTYDMPGDEDVALAKSLVQLELADSLGFPGASEHQLKEGLALLYKPEEDDDSESWAHARMNLVYDTRSRIWLDASDVSESDQLVGYAALLDECREDMAKEASRAQKSEKKLAVTLGGYQVRAKNISQRITDAFADLQKAQIEYVSFSQLHANENATGPRRLAVLKEEVDRLDRRERILQTRYAELDTERRDSEARVAVLEEKVMLEAEAMNEAALAELETTET